MDKPSEKSIHIAAQCWCDEETKDIEMDTRLGMAFAKRLDVNYFAIAELTERNLSLAAENEKLKDQVALLEYRPPSAIMVENSKLREVNAELVKALNECIDEIEGCGAHRTTFSVDAAKETLAKHSK